MVVQKTDNLRKFGKIHKIMTNTVQMKHRDKMVIKTILIKIKQLSHDQGKSLVFLMNMSFQIISLQIKMNLM